MRVGVCVRERGGEKINDHRMKAEGEVAKTYMTWHRTYERIRRTNSRLAD